jgi:hypothetical protein
VPYKLDLDSTTLKYTLLSQGKTKQEKEEKHDESEKEQKSVPPTARGMKLDVRRNLMGPPKATLIDGGGKDGIGEEVESMIECITINGAQKKMALKRVEIMSPQRVYIIILLVLLSG